MILWFQEGRQFDAASLSARHCRLLDALPAKRRQQPLAKPDQARR